MEPLNCNDKEGLNLVLHTVWSRFLAHANLASECLPLWNIVDL